MSSETTRGDVTELLVQTDTTASSSKFFEPLQNSALTNLCFSWFTPAPVSETCLKKTGSVGYPASIFRVRATAGAAPTFGFQVEDATLLSRAILLDLLQEKRFEKKS